MFRRLLVPTDGSDQLNETLPLVRHLAARNGASIVLICVESPVVNMGNIVDNRSALEGHAQKVGRMERCIEELEREGFQAHYDVAFGRPEQRIGSAARQHDSDLIVMTPHHREGLEAMLHPSITARMFSNSPAPLLIVPERDATGTRAGLLDAQESVIVVPLDGSELGERALPFAIALAEDYQRGMHLVQIVPPPRAPTAEAFEPANSRYQRQVNDARRYLGSIQAGMKRMTRLPVDVEVTVGGPAGEIADIAEEYPTNLIVMSTHGYGTIGRVLLGSVAADVMWRSKVPVLIVPPHARARSAVAASATEQVASHG